MMQSTRQNKEYDVIVAGAGIAGISAAAAAASLGVNVLLIEHYNFVGGMSSAGMVSPFMKSSTGGIDLVKGIFLEMEERMVKLGGMIDNGFYAWAFRSVCWDLLNAYGVDVLYSADLIDVATRGNRVVSVTLALPGGIKEVTAKQFIDTTGDAQLVYLAGFPWVKGDEKTKKLQALTMFFRMGGIDVKKTAEYTKQHKEDFLSWMDFNYDFDKIISIAGYKGLLEKAKQEGRIPQEIEYVFFTTLASTGEASFNCTNILGLDSSFSKQLTLADRIGNEQVNKIVEFLVKDVPGFENAWLIETAAQTGVRETRRVVSEYMMTGEDILHGAKFEDVIARACYGIDIHGQKGEKSRMEELAEGNWYDIPLRTLFVKDTQNIMAAGRCIGATREGHSALRIMPTAAATGEACGVTAALAVKNNCSLREVPYPELKKHLLHNIA
jgi:hypothetical protein